MSEILEKDYAICSVCHGDWPKEDMINGVCIWCLAELGGEG
jgi:hypothetical protein